MTTARLDPDARTSERGVDATDGRLLRWGVPLSIFLVSRVVDGLLLWRGAAHQVQLTAENFGFFMARDFPSRPGYLDVITTWDGQFYRYLAEDGYGVAAAGDPQLHLKELAWSFPPGFPYLVRGLMEVTGGSFAVVSTVLNIGAGALAMVLLHDLVRRHADTFLAVAVVATTSFFVSAPLFQTAYTESLGLLLLVLVLRDLDSGRFGRAAAWTLVLSLVRIITPPLAVVALALLWHRRRHGTRSTGEVLRAVVVVVASAAGALLWTLISQAVPGRDGTGAAPGAAADRTSDLLQLTVRWVAQAWSFGGLLGLVAGALVVGTFLLLPLTRTGRELGPALQAWLVAYPFFLFSVTIIQPGMIRYLLLAPGVLVPLLGPVRSSRWGRWVALAVVVVVLVAGQVWFVDTLVVVDDLTQRFGP